MDAFVKIDGLSFRYRLEGPESAPLVILSNPLSGSIELWNQVVPPLVAAHYRVLRYDQRGHGKTEAPENATTFERLAQDVSDLLDHLKISKARAFIGDSMGGATGVIGVAKGDLPGIGAFKDKIERLVVCDSPVSKPSPENDAFEPRAKLALEKGKAGMEELAAGTIERWFSPQFISSNPEMVKNIRTTAAETPVEGFVSCVRALQADTFNLPSLYSTINTPTLVIVGANDSALRPLLKDMAEKISGAKFIEIQDAGHVPMVDQPETFLSSVLSFLT